tara:strand:+ start:134 stop:301 length:168 start_codon:yes stop_codon:yes gene_type:complete
MRKLLIAPLVLLLGYSHPSQAGYADLGVNIVSSSLYADITICLSGDTEEWFRNAN